MQFEDALSGLGFTPSQDRGFRQQDVRLHTANPNEYMTYSVHAYPDGTAMFSWEFALGDYLGEHGIQIGSAEPLNQYMFAKEDLRGSQDGAWLVSAIEQTEAMLAAIRFDRP